MLIGGTNTSNTITHKQVMFYVFANEAGGGLRQPGLSGGDRIFIEFVKRWASSGIKVKILLSESGHTMYKRYIKNESKISFTVTHRYTFNNPSTIKFVLFEFHSLIVSLLSLRKLRNSDMKVCFSASDFPGDSLPALILKLFGRKGTKWVATFWLFAPNPFTKESPYKGLRKIRNLLYFMNQRFVYPFVRKYADIVWVTNELDRWSFIDNRRLTPDRVIAVQGGVDIKTPTLIPEPRRKKFDAVFIGRFHPQKGVLELLEIWRYVCERKKGAELAMIGVGDLQGEIMRKIRDYGLDNDVILFGYKDGIEKLEIFKDSTIVVHPAIYDSGGMAACEAMACGLPGVSFDLPALRTYYPKGMLKTPCFDLSKFADNILRLLNDKQLRAKLSKEALELAQKWDWEKRANESLVEIKKLVE